MGRLPSRVCVAERSSLGSGAIPHRDRKPSGKEAVALTVVRTQSGEDVEPVEQEEERLGLTVYDPSLLDPPPLPETRGQCRGGIRPCPHTQCDYHLWLVRRVRTEQGMRPHTSLAEMPETCSLDVADRLGSTLEQVGHILSLTRERVRQIEVRALAKLGYQKRRLALYVPPKGTE